MLQPAPAMLAILHEWGQLGKPLEIIEFDAGCADGATHGQCVGDAIIAAFSHPSVTAFIL